MMDFATYMTAPRPPKRKTYGKRAATSNTQTFSHFAESPPKSKDKLVPSDWSPDPSPPPAHVVSPAPKAATGKLKQLSPKRPRDVDMFDVPPSDNERARSPRPYKRLKSPVTQHGTQRRVVPIMDKVDSPRRVKEQVETAGTMNKRTREVDDAELQLLQENAIYQQKVHPARTDGQGTVAKARAVTGTAGNVIPKPASRIAKKKPQPTAKATAVEETDDKARVRRPPKSFRTAPKVALQNVSAPARLAEMVSESSESSDAPVARALVTPKRARFDESSSSPRTPPRTGDSPGSAGDMLRSGSATPRQVELWSKLLSTERTDSPSKLTVDKLRISSTTKAPTVIALPPSVSDTGVPSQARRRRLIDSLARTNAVVETKADTDEDESMTDDSSVLESSYEDPVHDQQLEAEVAATSLGQAPLKVTYGQARSYMEESGLEAELLMESPIVPIVKPSSSLNSRQAKPTKRNAALAQQDEDDDLEESQGQMKSVHELRAAGESRRFVDDFENLLEDVQYRGSASWSRQRNGMMELCEKLMNPKFVRRMVDADLDQRLLKACSNVPDLMFNFVIASAIALIANAEPPLSVLRHIWQSDCFDMLFTLLSQDTDVKLLAKDRKNNMSKVAQTSVADFSNRLKSSPLWSSVQPTKLSPQVVALKANELVVRGMRRSGCMDDLLDERKTSDFLQILERQLSNEGTSSAADPLIVELALSTLEAGSIVPGRIQTAWTPRRMERLASVLPAVLQSESSSTMLTPLALRLMLNLTNGKPAATNIFAKTELVQPLVAGINGRFTQLSEVMEVQDDEEEAPIDDRLILSLGAMINLAESSDAARTPLLDDDHKLLNALLATFLDSRSKVAEADSLALTASNVAYGWLTVLLGNLCENEDVKRAVTMKLPGANLSSLVDAIEEFVAYNKVADRSAFDGEEGSNVWRVFTERLANVAEKLRASQ